MNMSRLCKCLMYSVRLNLCDNTTICLATRSITYSTTTTSYSPAKLTNFAATGTNIGNNNTQRALLVVCSSSKLSQRRHYKEPRKPVTFDYSGDINRQQDLDEKELFFPFRGIEDDVKDLPDDLKKSMTLEFADGPYNYKTKGKKQASKSLRRNQELRKTKQQKLAHRFWDTRERFLRICKMGDKYEMNIARMTVQIRNLKEHCIQFKKDKSSKVHLVEKIQMRKKLLKRLRREDYERFGWLLRELQIQYTVPPVYHGHESKRARARRLVREEAIALTRQKIAQVYERLEKERVDFQEERKAILAKVNKDIEEYGLDKTEIEYNVEIMRRNQIEARKNPHTPLPNTFQYLFYLRKQKLKAEDEARLKKVMLRRKREEDAINSIDKSITG